MTSACSLAYAVPRPLIIKFSSSLANNIFALIMLVIRGEGVLYWHEVGAHQKKGIASAMMLAELLNVASLHETM